MRARRTRVWATQPPAGFRLNRASPFAADLQVLWTAAGAGYEVIKKYNSTPMQPSGAAATSPLGTGVAPYFYGGDMVTMTGSSTSGVRMTANQSDCNVAAGQDFTMLQLCLTRAASYEYALNNRAGSGSGIMLNMDPNGVYWAQYTDDTATSYGSSSNTITIGKANTVQPVWAQRQGSNLYVLSAQKSHATAASTNSITNGRYLGVGVGAAVYLGTPLYCSLAAFWTRALSLGERLEIEANPWQLFEPVGRRRAYSIPASAITGSGASTDVDTSAASGTESIAGAGASSDVDASSAAGSESISGTGASNDADQASAAGSESIAGSGASADSDAATATGSEAISGTGASADTDTSAAIGTLSDAGTGASADVDASAATGGETITGSGASTDIDQSLASGSAGSGGVGASVDVDTSSATGGITESGSGASADVDASSATGGEAITGSGASADKDTSTATGSVLASITGSGASQDVDTSTALAGETIAGVGASTDVDVSSATGSQPTTLVSDPGFVVLIPAREFAAQIPARGFIAQAPERTFTVSWS